MTVTAGLPTPSVVTRAGHDAATARLARLNTLIEETQAQISTGKRARTPADDPVAAARAASLRRAQAGDAASLRSLDAAARRLRLTDITISSVTDMAQRIRELGLAGSNATMSPADRQVLALEVRELAAAIAGLANTEDADGLPLFGGAAPAPAHSPDADGVPGWAGAGAPPAINLAGTILPTALPGPAVFGEDPSLFQTMNALASALETPDSDLQTPLAALEAGLDRLADAQAIAGTRAARIEREVTRLEAQGLTTSIDLSRLQDTDMTVSIARLQRLLTVLEAAQASFARTASQSLWDALR